MHEIMITNKPRWTMGKYLLIIFLIKVEENSLKLPQKPTELSSVHGHRQRRPNMMTYAVYSTQILMSQIQEKDVMYFSLMIIRINSIEI